jgi:Rod binding domain-containing protein
MLHAGAGTSGSGLFHNQHPLFGKAKHALAGSGAQQHAKLVEQARKWVGLTFFGTMLQQMRKSPFHSKLTDGGRGGQAFTDMYDQEIAQRMGRGAGSKLVNSLVHKVEARRAYANQAKGPSTAAAKVNSILSARG